MTDIDLDDPKFANGYILTADETTGELTAVPAGQIDGAIPTSVQAEAPVQDAIAQAPDASDSAKDEAEAAPQSSEGVSDTEPQNEG